MKQLSTMEEDLMAAMNGEDLAEAVDVDDDLDPAAASDGDPVEKPVEDTPAAEPVEVPASTEPKTPAPQGWTGEAKGEWDKIPAAVQKEILRRETDVHKMFTAHDGELNMGRKIKEVVSPYMAMIQSEGGTPEGAFKDLLNTAYLLRTADPMRKAQLVQEVCKQFNVDMSLIEQQQYEMQDPNYQVRQLQEQLSRLQEQANPANIEASILNRLQGQQVQSEVDAFGADSRNVHFQTVRPLMATLIQNGQAKDLQEAYDMACYANPNVRSTLQAANQQELEAKRRQELESKRKAGSSIAGSPATKVSSTGKSEKTLEEDIEDAMNALSNQL